MDKFDIWFKSVLAMFGTLFSIVASGLGVSFTILIILQAVDYATGLLAAMATTGLKSSIGFKGLAKKLYVLILVGVIYILEINLFGTTHLGNGICIAYIVIELVSITENGGRMGAPIPAQVTKFIETLNGKGEQK